MVPRKKRFRYKLEAEAIAKRNGWKFPKTWEEVWDILDKHSAETKPSHVYAIADYGNNLVKIGRSVRPGQRLKALQTSNGTHLKLWGYCRESGKLTEKLIHESLKDYREIGEWFRITPAVQAVISEIRDASRKVS